jgi:hypothetical protein
VTTFVVKQGDASLVARFTSPLFELLSNSNVALHPNMLLHLGKYGLTLNDVRIELGIPTLAGANAAYWMNALSAVVRIWLDRLEIAFLDLTRITGDQVTEITGAALEALQQSVSNVSIETYTATLTLHGTFQDVSLSQFVAQFVKRAPKNLGPVLGSGVVYYLGPELERRTASVVIDRSTMIADAAFIRTTVILDGALLPFSSVSAVARASVFKMFEAIKLEVNWGG